jgi:hypothetical protein
VSERGIALAERIEGELAEQRRALLSGDWSALAECAERQELLLGQLSVDTLSATQRPLLRRLRRGADRNARLALRLREGLQRRLKGSAREVTYNARGRLSAGARALLERRG